MSFDITLQKANTLTFDTIDPYLSNLMYNYYITLPKVGIEIDHYSTIHKNMAECNFNFSCESMHILTIRLDEEKLIFRPHINYDAMFYHHDPDCFIKFGEYVRAHIELWVIAVITARKVISDAAYRK